MPTSVYVSFDAPEGGASHAQEASRRPVSSAGLTAGYQPGQGRSETAPTTRESGVVKSQHSEKFTTT